MIRLVLLLLAALALPARAAPAIEGNEPLVMRLIFEDCLGFLRNGRTPFAGLSTRPASPEAIKQLPTRMPNRLAAVELLSPRYVASWGEDADSRHCYVGTVLSTMDSDLPAKLGVRVTGFLGRVTARAKAAGLSKALVSGEFSPISISSWSEPGKDADSGPNRPISFSVLPTTPPNAHGVTDAGLIVMGGPPGGRRR